MPTEIKAIETEFKGYRFRSRMEARWAVFMDTLGVQFLYEPEAYALADSSYLPDFWVPEVDGFVEVKNPMAPSGEWEKCEQLAQAIGKRVYVFSGPPQLPDWKDYQNEGAMCCFPDVGTDFHYLWCECKTCHKTGIQFDGRAYRIRCSCPREGHPDKGYNYDSQRLIRAYDFAKAWRFEPGASNF